MLAKCKMLPGIAERALAPVSPSIRGIGGRGRSHMERMLGRSDGMEQLDSVPCDNWVEFDSDPFADSHLNADPGTIIAFPGKIFGQILSDNHSAASPSAALSLAVHPAASSPPHR